VNVEVRASDVTGVVLCGGLGTRLRPTVPDRPKFLVEVGGAPFAHYVLDALARSGVRRAVLCTGFMGDKIEHTLGTAFGGLELTYSHEQTPLGTGGALRAACDHVQTRLVLAMNGDSLCEVDLGALVAFHEARGGDATVLLARVDDPRRFGRVVLGERGRIVRFEEKGDDPSPAWVNAGVYVIPRKCLLEIPAGRPVSLEREVLSRWADKGALFGYTSDGTLIDIGTPESLRSAAERLGA
jgi:NDP-sugar pyrophosphorylase family protein